MICPAVAKSVCCYRKIFAYKVLKSSFFSRTRIWLHLLFKHAIKKYFQVRKHIFKKRHHRTQAFNHFGPQRFYITKSDRCLLGFRFYKIDLRKVKKNNAENKDIKQHIKKDTAKPVKPTHHRYFYYTLQCLGTQPH